MQTIQAKTAENGEIRCDEFIDLPHEDHQGLLAAQARGERSLEEVSRKGGAAKAKAANTGKGSTRRCCKKGRKPVAGVTHHQSSDSQRATSAGSKGRKRQLRGSRNSATGTGVSSLDELSDAKRRNAAGLLISPQAPSNDNDIVWRGVVKAGPTHKIQASARRVTEDIFSQPWLSWQQLIPSEISLVGRADPERADSYLSGLHDSSFDIIILSISRPKSPIDQQHFDEFFDYFRSRNRYGVWMGDCNPAIERLYVIPLEVGSELPELLSFLPSHELKEPVSERLLLIPFVAKSGIEPS